MVNLVFSSFLRFSPYTPANPHLSLYIVQRGPTSASSLVQKGSLDVHRLLYNSPIGIVYHCFCNLAQWPQMNIRANTFSTSIALLGIRVQSFLLLLILVHFLYIVRRSFEFLLLCLIHLLECVSLFLCLLEKLLSIDHIYTSLRLILLP